MTVESISDELLHLVLEVAELRSAVVEQRIVLDELRARSDDSSRRTYFSALGARLDCRR
jgi:hypothetical protein